MTHSLKGKTALITGGARGIGKATALKLAEHGCDIAIIYFNSSDEAESLVKTIKELGQDAMAIQANVADHKSVKEMYQLSLIHI